MADHPSTRIALLGPKRVRCGITDYDSVLWPAIEEEASKESRALGLNLEIKRFEFEGPSDLRSLVDALSTFKPNVLHVQHEYGLYGGKNPPFYEFPRWSWYLKQALPKTKLIVTAHTVLDPHYRFPLKGRAWQIPFRAAANRFLIKPLRRLWGPQTWAHWDCVVAHSRHQLLLLESSGARRQVCIPHFVPSPSGGVVDAAGPPKTNERFRCLVFGFFTPEKGQDVAIEAWGALRGILPSNRMPELLLAGGVRRPADRAYRDRCLERIDELKLGAVVRVGDFIPAGRIDALYRETDLVLTPFRETSGSGSIAQALARGAAILASDLTLNRELNERVNGCLEFFPSESPQGLAQALASLMRAPEKLRTLRQNSASYAKEFNPASTARAHLKLYLSEPTQEKA